MNVSSSLRGDTVYIYLNGELDEYSAPAVRKKVDEILDASTAMSKAIFNLAQVQFMDSTGIGFLIGRYKKLLRYSMPMFLEQPNRAADKVLSVSGVYTLIPKV